MATVSASEFNKVLKRAYPLIAFGYLAMVVLAFPSFLRDIINPAVQFLASVPIINAVFFHGYLAAFAIANMIQVLGFIVWLVIVVAKRDRSVLDFKKFGTLCLVVLLTILIGIYNSPVSYSQLAPLLGMQFIGFMQMIIDPVVGFFTYLILLSPALILHLFVVVSKAIGNNIYKFVLITLLVIAGINLLAGMIW
jgi:hypothetical protein